MTFFNSMFLWETSTILILLNYIILTVNIFLIFSILTTQSFKSSFFNNNQHSIFSWFILLFFLNLAGVPPLPGFFIKLNLLIPMLGHINIFLITILIVINFTIFYLYIQLYKNIQNYGKVKYCNIPSWIVYGVLISLCLNIFAYPLYNFFLLIL